MTIKHDVLYCKTIFYAVRCEINTKEKILKTGYIFVDNIKTNVLIVQSHTHEEYKVKIPDNMLNLLSSQQFNYDFELTE